MGDGGDDKTVKTYFADMETACKSGQGAGVDVTAEIIARERLMCVYYVYVMARTYVKKMCDIFRCISCTGNRRFRPTELVFYIL